MVRWAPGGVWTLGRRHQQQEQQEQQQQEEEQEEEEEEEEESRWWSGKPGLSPGLQANLPLLSSLF